MTAGKNFKIAQHYYKHYKSFRQVFNVSGNLAQQQTFVIAHFFHIMQFDIMQFDIMRQKCFNCSYRGSNEN